MSHYHLSILACSAALLIGSIATSANAQTTDSTQNVTDASPDIKHNLNIAPAFVGEANRSGRTAPDIQNKLASTLDGLGIYPSVMLLENAFDSGTLGVAPGKVQSVSTLAAGLDLDLGKLVGLHGGAFHFLYLDNFKRINTPVTLTMGAFPLGMYPPNSPKTDVPIFTYEQKLLNDKLDIEVGRKQIFWFFTDEFTQWEAFSRVLQNTWLTLVPPYATWSARARYEFGGGYYAQLGVWEANPTLYGKSGWDWSTGGATGVTFLETLGYHSSYRDTRYPGHFEITAYTNASHQTDPYYTVNGTSQVFDSTASARVHHGASGITVSGGKVFHRWDDRGAAVDGDVQALYAYGSFGANLQSWAPAGVAYDAYAGVSWLNPFHLLNDVIGAKVEVTQLTSSKQQYLKDANLSVGGTGYSSPRTTAYGMLYGHFELGKTVAIDPVMAYGVGANTVFDPFTTQRSKNGYVLGAFIIVNVGNLLGLPSPPHP